MNKVHNLKCWPEYFKEIAEGRKLFEVRKNDRDYKVWDILHLQEYSPSTGNYTGQFIHMQVTFILDGGIFGVSEGFVVMSLKAM